MENRKNTSKSMHMLDFSFLGEDAKKSFYLTPDAVAEEIVMAVLENLPDKKNSQLPQLTA